MVYLLRINLDIEENPPEKSLRFCQAVQTIRKISKNGKKIVILSHRGRPQRAEPQLSLKHFIEPLTKALGKKVTFLELNDFKKLKKIIDRPSSGSIFLLENLRFIPGETLNDVKLAKALASLGDKYINDDFATSHRKNASNVGILKFLPSSAGPNLRQEVKKLRLAVKKSSQPFILIIGGAKISDKIGVIKRLLPKLNYVLLGGGAANTFLKAAGEKIDGSIFDEKLLPAVKQLLRHKKIIIPWDAKKQEGKILDIGPITQRRYSAIIKQAKTIIWGGPMGAFEKAEFSQGTKSIWQALLKNSQATVIVGGGETIASLKLVRKSYRLPANIFLSTGGGAMLAFLAGKKMPALAGLKLQTVKL